MRSYMNRRNPTKSKLLWHEGNYYIWDTEGGIKVEDAKTGRTDYPILYLSGEVGWDTPELFPQSVKAIAYELLQKKQPMQYQGKRQNYMNRRKDIVYKNYDVMEFIKSIEREDNLDLTSEDRTELYQYAIDNRWADELEAYQFAIIIRMWAEGNWHEDWEPSMISMEKYQTSNPKFDISKKYIFSPFGLDLWDPKVIRGVPIDSGSIVEVTETKIDPLGKFVWIKDEKGNEQSVYKTSLEPLHSIRRNPRETRRYIQAIALYYPKRDEFGLRSGDKKWNLTLHQFESYLSECGYLNEEINEIVKAMMAPPFGHFWIRSSHSRNPRKDRWTKGYPIIGDWISYRLREPAYGTGEGEDNIVKVLTDYITGKPTHYVMPNGDIVGIDEILTWQRVGGRRNPREPRETRYQEAIRIARSQYPEGTEEEIKRMAKHIFAKMLSKGETIGRTDKGEWIIGEKRRNPVWLWLRLGDVAEYEKYDSIEEVKDLFEEFGLTKDFYRGFGRYGIANSEYKGYNYISLYYGDDEAQPIKEISDSELAYLNK